MGLEALERITQQIKMNLQDSSQRNHENLQKLNERGQRQTSYKCDKCRDTGWILIPQENRQPLALSCECRKIEKLKNEWKYSGINVEQSKHTFSNFEVWNQASSRIKDTAAAYCTDFNEIRNGRRNSILLCGQVGSGKTHCSIAIALNFLKQRIKVVHMPYRDVITKIKQNMIDQEYYSKAISKYQTCEVLLIDDLFKGKINDSDINIVFKIINYRYLNFLPIIVSSEFSIDRLLGFDEGVGSRIYEMAKDYVVEIEKDVRNNYRLK
ncbi:DNA replication protein DnaC [Clostridium saccharobutylicum]|nr:DNA replication protein DnaC [Clostridium saccharobutylicum]NYC29325.1 DNA replication protein DnaC [Clostridium saccharobutylicum]